MVGKILGKRYEIIEKIGGGGMALVYKARCQLLNRYVAIKILRSEFTNDRELLSEFRKESQAAASLSHPNIVNIYDVGEEDNIYYIVMEYVNSKTLKELINEEGKLSTEKILDFARQIALALKHAHYNHIIHRDIKPHNILVTDDGRVKVTDFGIALAATSSTITNAGSIIGSVHYFAPEQARGGYTDEKSDLYSLGIVMYEMATGRLPFEGDAPITIALKHIQEKPELPSKYNPSIPKDLESIIMKLIQKEQSARYASTEDLIEDLYKVKSNISLGDIDNTLKIEDSPTQIIPASTANEIKELINSKGDIGDDDMAKKKNNKKDNKKRKLLIGSAVTAALLAALLFTYGFFYLANFFKVEDVKVPQFEGQNISEAEAEAERVGLQLNATLINNNNVPENEIIKQDIAQGMMVRKNTIIKVTVSKGSKVGVVPYLLYESATKAEDLLKRQGLERGDVDREFSELPEGTIIRQNPKEGKEVPQGTRVDYTISKGPKPETIFMPQLVGKTLEEARGIIEENKLVLEEENITQKYSDLYLKGYVMEQSIPVSQEIEVGSTVNLVISKGIEGPGEDEDLDEREQNNNGKEPPEQGDNKEDERPAVNNTVTKTITFSLSEYSGTVEVTVEELSGDKEKRVYKRKHDLDKGSKVISVPVIGTGQQRYSIYVNGQLFGIKDVNF